jgi:hypothetical protein
MSGGVAGGLVVLVAGLVVFGASVLLLVEVVDGAAGFAGHHAGNQQRNAYQSVMS